MHEDDELLDPLRGANDRLLRDWGDYAFRLLFGSGTASSAEKDLGVADPERFALVRDRYEQTPRKDHQRYGDDLSDSSWLKIQRGARDPVPLCHILASVPVGPMGKTDIDDVHKARKIRNQHSHYDYENGAVPEAHEVLTLCKVLLRLYRRLNSTVSAKDQIRIVEHIVRRIEAGDLNYRLQEQPKIVERFIEIPKIIEKTVERIVERKVEVPKVVERVVEIEKRIEVPKIVEKEVEVEKIVYAPAPRHPFATPSPVTTDSSRRTPGASLTTHAKAPGDSSPIEMSPDQQRAIDAFESWWKEDRTRQFVLAGSAGTGKSTVLKKIVEKIQKDTSTKRGLTHSAVRFLVPTNKAKAVLKAILPSPWKQQVVTFHSFLWLSKLDGYEGEDSKWLSEKPLKPVDHPTKREVKLIIIDEGSMLTQAQYDVLYEQHQGLRMVIVGDPLQLPPIIQPEEDTRPWDGLSHPDAELTASHRQSTSPILQMTSKMIREGKTAELPLGRTEEFLYWGEEQGLTEQDFNNLLLSYEMILCARNRSRIFLNDRVRILRNFKKHPTDNSPKPGERVIAIEENRDAMDGRGVKKGEVLEILEYLGTEILRYRERDGVREPVFEFRVRVRLIDAENQPGETGECILSSQILANEHLHGSYRDTRNCTGPKTAVASGRPLLRCEWGYALTVHNAQGSQWDSVVVIMEDPHDRGLSSKQWLYVASTRPRRKLALLSVANDSKFTGPYLPI